MINDKDEIVFQELALWDLVYKRGKVVMAILVAIIILLYIFLQAPDKDFYVGMALVLLILYAGGFANRKTITFTKEMLKESTGYFTYCFFVQPAYSGNNPKSYDADNKKYGSIGKTISAEEFIKQWTFYGICVQLKNKEILSAENTKVKIDKILEVLKENNINNFTINEEEYPYISLKYKESKNFEEYSKKIFGGGAFFEKHHPLDA